VNEVGEERSQRKVWWIALGVVGVAVIAIITVVAALGGSTSKGPLTLTQVQPVTVTGAGLPELPAGTTDASPGRATPRIDGRTFGSRAISIKPGKPTMIVVIEPGDAGPDNLAQVSQLVQWHHANLTPDALNVVTVVTGPGRATAKDLPSTWLVRAEWPWPVLVDDEAGTARLALGMAKTPGIILVDASGVVKYREQGIVAPAELAKTITADLGV
jgi:hypothetical protein